MVAHGSWNASALLADGQMFVLTYLFAMVPAFLLLAGFALWARHREGRCSPAASPTRRDRGLIDPAEVPWLVAAARPAGRRGYAKRHGGPVADQAMREYQQQAVELGFLHDRYLRGTAPPDFAQRGAAMVHRLRRPAAHVLVPAERLGGR